MNRLFFMLLASAFLCSCAKVQPTACFTMDAGDTISINTRVQFDAGCSKDAAQYKWAMNDTSMGSINPSRFFRVAGSYSIILTVTNGNKTAETTKLLTVK